jgi:hypothetical protein
MAGPVLPPGTVKQAGRAGAETGQLYRPRGDRGSSSSSSTMRGGRPPARQMPDDHDRQHSENHDHCQPPGPPAGLAVPAMAQDVIHNPHHLEQPMPA